MIDIAAELDRVHERVVDREKSTSPVTARLSVPPPEKVMATDDRVVRSKVRESLPFVPVILTPPVAASATGACDTTVFKLSTSWYWALPASSFRVRAAAAP